MRFPGGDIPSTLSWILERLRRLELQLTDIFRNGVIQTHTHVDGTQGGALNYAGTGSIANGTTSATVTHGAGFTPTLQQIMIALGENPTNDPGIIWVDTIGATTFRVNCRNDPGASNLDFGWRVTPT